MKKLLIIATFVLLPVFANAAQGNVIHIGVNGMVCDICAQSVKKLFLKKPEVQKVDISLEKKLVTLETKPGQGISDKDIKQVIDYSGYDVTTIHRMTLKNEK